MKLAALVLIAAPTALLFYAYVGYPLLLRLLAFFRRRPSSATNPERWPFVTITLPAYNEEKQIRGSLENLLLLDYPADRRQILVVSDASTDRTDAIVREFAARGVELLRLRRRSGKTAAENAALPHLRGEIVVNTDASTRFHPAGLKPLIAAFGDPTVGVASGRDVSVSARADDANRGEAGYVGYEMWVRGLETRIGGIVGASGCYYAIRADLHRMLLPEAAVRDFAAPLIAREHGYRSVSVEDAVCYVPRTASLRREYQRKVRTMSGGMDTLLVFRRMLNPMQYGIFGWMLASHKLCRWLVPVGVLPALVGLVLLAWVAGGPVAAVGCVVAGLLLAAALAWIWSTDRKEPRPLLLLAYAAAGNVAALHAWSRILRGKLPTTWDPTPRDTIDVKMERAAR
jgi:cellulose synthase/poly-beta-1,6-N-acetylglucosamine synthase-like glycosyltransferase